MTRDQMRQLFDGTDSAPGNLKTGPCGGCSVTSSSPSVCGTCGPSKDGENGSGRSGPAVHVKETSAEKNSWLNRDLTRREMLRTMGAGGATGAHLLSSLNPLNWFSSGGKQEKALIEWEEYFKENFRLMTDEEKRDTVDRLERRYRIERGIDVDISASDAIPGVLYGYAFNVSKCKGYRDCVSACVRENNLDRESNMQYIRIFEMEHGNLNVEDARADYFHQVPAEGHFYLGTQCFQCENPPCVEVCPVGATWKEPDGIVVVDYDWCIGCRYCEAACPYWARRFNWTSPVVPNREINPDQHYLGNRLREKGVMEKCTFCIQRTREGQLPACAEACPTGARTFGNLLDPGSEIRYILENKKVFRLKEDLNTEPKFWYYMD